MSNNHNKDGCVILFFGRSLQNLTQPGIEPVPPALGAQSQPLDYETGPLFCFLNTWKASARET